MIRIFALYYQEIATCTPSLSSGTKNIVLALDPIEFAKPYLEEIRYDFGSEAENMCFANKVNGLACRFIRLDFYQTHNDDVLVSERIYPIDNWANQVKRRTL